MDSKNLIFNNNDIENKIKRISLEVYEEVFNGLRNDSLISRPFSPSRRDYSSSKSQKKYALQLFELITGPDFSNYFDDFSDMVKGSKSDKLQGHTSRFVTILKEIDGTISYNLPKNLLGIIWKGKYKGQIQKWFIMKFNGTDEEINLKTKNPEFLEWKWIDIDKITDSVVEFKLEVYKKLKNEVKKIISN